MSSPQPANFRTGSIYYCFHFYDDNNLLAPQIIRAKCGDGEEAYFKTIDYILGSGSKGDFQYQNVYTGRLFCFISLKECKRAMFKYMFANELKEYS
jgi:hypothetical protein